MNCACCIITPIWLESDLLPVFKCGQNLICNKYLDKTSSHPMQLFVLCRNIEELYLILKARQFIIYYYHYLFFDPQSKAIYYLFLLFFIFWSSEQGNLLSFLYYYYYSSFDPQSKAMDEAAGEVAAEKKVKLILRRCEIIPKLLLIIVKLFRNCCHFL